MENISPQNPTNQVPEIKPTPTFNKFKYLFFLFLTLFLATLGILISILTKKDDTVVSTPNISVTPTPTTVEQSAEVLKISDIQIDLPIGWKVVSVSQDEAKILTDYQNHQVYLTLVVYKNNTTAISNYQENTNNLITTQYGQVYQGSCIGGALTCTGALINDSKYSFYWDIESNQPTPKNLDGIWRPDHNVTTETILNITKTVRSTDNTIDPTSDWNIYQNEQIGIQFSHPPDLTIEYLDSNCANIPKHKCINVYKGNQVYFSIDEYEFNQAGRYFEDESTPRQKLSFGDNDFYYYNDPGPSEGSFNYNLDKKIDIATFEKDKHIHDKQFEKILSTFKIIQ